MENVQEAIATACDCQVCGKPRHGGPLKVHIVEFDVQGVGKGNAIVKAENPRAAENLLKYSGMFNGTPYLYKIKKIEELDILPCAGVLSENIVTVKEVMEDSYMS